MERLGPESGLAKAIRYSLGHWHALTRYCEDGRVEVENNTAERAIRPLVLGRRYVRSTIMLSSSGEPHLLA
ncbi:hypothetical protein WT26_20935 [Burkholderia cepacia]|uniref:Transposase IS66 central domain-containing protein n=2 Tax=Burkholderia cepacia complex TaxID=87882 RepID=A0A1B4PX32_BURCE|nr:hypothetical protein WT26_20935 [Burkholderia cepacia]AOK25270.1 hypothetical protein WK67_20865 [Burkholderia ubonensis]